MLEYISDGKGESEFQRRLIGWAQKNGWVARWDPPKTRGVVKGWPDLILMREEWMVWAELKMPGGACSPEQLDILHQVRATGNIAVVWNGLDERGIKEFLADPYGKALPGRHSPLPEYPQAEYPAHIALAVVNGMGYGLRSETPWKWTCGTATTIHRATGFITENWSPKGIRAALPPDEQIHMELVDWVIFTAKNRTDKGHVVLSREEAYGVIQHCIERQDL